MQVGEYENGLELSSYAIGKAPDGATAYFVLHALLASYN